MMNKKTILITGASRGIGLGIAKYFKDSSFDVYITGRHKEILKKLCDENNFKGFAAIDLFCDNAAEKLFNELNINIDILINNAGVYFYSPIEEMKKNDIINSVKLNTLVPYELTRLVIPYMKKQHWGRIINIGSISGIMGEAYASVYSMTKASLTGLTKSLALELAQNNITVNIINPGWVDTQLINNEALEENFSKEEIIETIPQRRFVTPKEIAQTCGFLISDGAKSITGQSINICAGLSLGC